jgi:hypothetical protein
MQPKNFETIYSYTRSTDLIESDFEIRIHLLTQSLFTVQYLAGEIAQHSDITGS